MAAYSRLTPAAWQPLSMRQAAPLLHTCLHDLRNGGGCTWRSCIEMWMKVGRLHITNLQLGCHRSVVLKNELRCPSHGSQHCFTVSPTRRRLGAAPRRQPGGVALHRGRCGCHRGSRGSRRWRSGCYRGWQPTVCSAASAVPAAQARPAGAQPGCAPGEPSMASGFGLALYDPAVRALRAHAAPPAPTQRMFFPRAAIPCALQEQLVTLRRLAPAFPSHYAELLVLTGGRCLFFGASCQLAVTGGPAKFSCRTGAQLAMQN